MEYTNNVCHPAYSLAGSPRAPHLFVTLPSSKQCINKTLLNDESDNKVEVFYAQYDRPGQAIVRIRARARPVQGPCPFFTKKQQIAVGGGRDSPIFNDALGAHQHMDMSSATYIAHCWQDVRARCWG